MGKLRDGQNNWENGGRKQAESDDVRTHDEHEKTHRSLVDWNQLEVDAMLYLNLSDFEYLYSLDLREWNNLMRAAILRDIKNYEDMTIQAIFIARANNEKHMSAKKMFNADKSRKKLMEKEVVKKDFTRYNRAQKAMRNYKIGTKNKKGVSE